MFSPFPGPNEAGKTTVAGELVPADIGLRTAAR